MQTKSGGRVLVVPRPKHVPRPGSAGKAALKAVRGGGVHKGSGPRTAPRSVKVTIGNKSGGCVGLLCAGVGRGMQAQHV